MDPVFIQSQIDFYSSAITAYQRVLLDLALNPAKSYTINTGQTTESVTRQDVDKIRALISGLITDLNYWQSLQSGGGCVVVTPGF